MKSFFRIILLLLLSNQCLAVTRTSTATGGTWATGSTWVGGVAPSATDDVIIATTGAGTVTLGAATVCAGLTINAGSILNIGAYAFTVNTGPTVISGTINFSSATGVKTFNTDITLNTGAVWNETAAAVMTIAGNFTNNATTFTASTGVHTFSGTNKTISGTTAFTITSATFTGSYVNSGTLTSTTLTVTGATVVLTNNGTINANNALSGTGGLTQGTTGILNIGNASAITTLNAAATGNTVNYSRANTQTAKAIIYHNLTLSGTSAKTFATTPTVNGTLSLEGTASVVVTTGVVTYGPNGTLKYNKTSAYTATAEEWISPFAATGGVIISNTGAINMGAAKSFNASIPLTINAGSTLTPGANLLTLGGDFINGGTFTSGSGGVTITGTAASQNISAFTTTGTLSITKTSGIAVLTGAVNCGPLILSATSLLDLGTFTSSASTMSLGGSGVINGSWGSSSSSATYENDTYFAPTTGLINIATGSCSAPVVSITGSSSLCLGATTTLSPTTGGTWTSSNVSVATVTNAGLVTSVAAGSATFTFSLTATGCSNTTAAITVNSFPSAPTTTGAQICIGSTATLSASGAGAGSLYNWYDAGVGGTLLKTSSNNADNTYTTPVLASTTDYWVSVLSAAGCEGSRSQVTATFPTLSSDNQSTEGANSWIGHVYPGSNFNNYYGNYTEAETFNQSFGGNTNCFTITSNSVPRTIYTDGFSVRYRMNSTKSGLYVADLGSDDGSRLTVDGALIYNNWVDQGFSTRASVLMKLNGNSSLVYDFYENAGGNQVVFQNLTQLIANTLTGNAVQSICMGDAGAPISGDVFSALPTGITLSGTGYQWAYSNSSATGPWTDIAGATSATLTPSTLSAPFNATGTYYVIRKATLSSSNNVAPNPYSTTIESNTATITVNPASAGGVISGGTSPLCLGSSTGVMTLSSYAGTIIRWERQINSGGWSSIGNENSATFSEIPYSAGLWEYRVVVQNGSCAIAYSTVAAITIDAVTAGGWISGSSAPVCAGVSTGTMTLTGSTGNIIRWEKRVNSGAWTNISNTLATYSEVPSSAGTWDYRALVQSGSCLQVYSTSFTITASADISITLGTNPSICFNTTTALLPYTATTGSPDSYSINFDAAANTAGFTDFANWGFTGPSPISISVPYGVAAGVYNATLTVGTFYPVCSSVAYPITITVNPIPVATFSYVGSTYCQGVANPLPTFSGGGFAGTFTSTSGLVFVSSATGQVDLTASTPGTYTVTNTINSGGCGVVAATSTITITPAVGTPVFALGATSSRSQGSGSYTYSATASNTSGITYSLDAASVAAGITIVPATGSVTFTAAWLGTTTITASAAGCNGPAVSTHSVTTTVTSPYYSYQTGNWNDPNTWTFDAGGTTGPITTIPGANDVVYILSDRTVTLTADVATTNLDISILEGGILDESTFRFTNTLAALRGGGTLQLSSASFPVVTNNTFVTTDRGTTEYRTAGAFDLPTVQTTYFHLNINNTGETARQINDLTINGDLHIKKGTYQINNTTANRRQLTIKGNVTVDAGAFVTVGTGNTITGSDTPLTVADGGTAPFLNYYNNETHKIIVQGDFTNNGTVKFTNQTAPKYDAFSSTGAATVYFQGSTDNLMTCNGQTDFYNLVVDKGTDQTFKLKIYSNAYANFRLFGPNTARSANSTTANPDLKKALWVRNGTLTLQGLTVIPSLSEGSSTSGANTSHYFIPANGAIVLDGSGVMVMATADDYTEVQAAYNLTGGSNILYGINSGSASVSGLSILGKLQVNNGYLSTRESAGLLYWSYASGQFILNNGTVDTKQFHNPEGGTNGLVTFMQTGGNLILRGRFQNIINYTSAGDLDNPVINTVRAANGIDGTAGIGTMHISANTSNGFIMTSGTMSIYDVPGTTATSYAFLVNCPVSNINVTGGTVQFIPTTGTILADANYMVNSLASFGNVIVNRVSGTSIVQLYTNPLNVLQNLSIQSGVFDANSQDVTVGSNFSISNGTTYTTGTNNTVFNGSGAQTFSVNLAAPLSLSTLKINKSATDILAFAGTQKVVNALSISILSGKLDDNGNTINVTGNIYNAGTHFSTPGTGKIVMNGAAVQSISGNGTGIFNNLDLNNTNASAAPISLSGDINITGTLNLVSSKIFVIGSNGLRLTSGASIISTAGFSNTCFIQTNGQAGDGGITKTYSSLVPFTFPVGTFSTKRPATYAYTPATIGFNATPATYGSVTVAPVGYEHPNTTVKSQSLTYFWRVKSSGFTGIVSNSVTHSFTYSQTDVNGTEANYIPALYSSSANTWNKGTNSNPPVNIATNNITDWVTPTFSTSFLDADYTAGDNAFGTPTKYYSRNGGGNWNVNATWSTDPVQKHNGAAATSFPGINDIVIIGKNSALLASTVTLTQVQSCASLQIEAGSVLDISTYAGSYFGMVVSHPNGNGLFRLTTTVTPSNVPKIFTFPTGDFSEFNSNSGTTEFYDIDGATGALYILPANVTTYGNLMVTAKGGDNLVLPNNSLTTIQGNLTCGGDNANAWIAMSWNTSTAPYSSNTYNPTIEKTVHVTGNMNINTGTFILMPENVPQHLIVDGNITVGANGYIETQPAIYGTPNGTPQPNTVAIGGSLINNSNGAPYVRFLNGTYYCDVTFQGSDNTTISGTSPQTIFNKVIVNKGTSQASTLTVNVGGTLSTPVDNWLSLRNGTLVYSRTGNFNIATGTALSIPSSAGLTLDNTASTITIGTNITSGTILSLSGKLKLTSNFTGNVLVGTNGVTAANHNDIQYSSGGSSMIEIANGNLIVNGQIRRDPSNAAGILSYTQTGGNVTILGNAVSIAPTNINNAKLEVLNNGSQFSMSGGTLTLVRGGGGNTFGDLYLRPTSGSVTGGTILFAPGANGNQTYQLDANIPLNHLTLTGSASNVPTAKLMVSPLILNGNCNIGTNTIFNTNNINTTFNGNFTNSVGTAGYVAGTNLTTFSATNSSSYLGAQSLSGATTFYNLLVNPDASLTVNNPCSVTNNLSLNSGTLILASNLVQVSGNFGNNGRYTDANVANTGIRLMGTVRQHISGAGNFGRLELSNSAGAQLDNDIYMEENLVLTTGILDINQYLLSLGLNSAIQGSSFSAAKMIKTDGVFSSLGIRKLFPTGASAAFLYPLGTAGKYTPVTLTKSASNTVGYVQINNVNKRHPAVIDPANALDYYWEVTSSGITGLTGSIVFNYLQSDVKGSQESSYVAARLIVPGTSWSLTATNNATSNAITFNHTGSNNLGGEYTAGINTAFPPDVPIYTSNKNGNWTDKTIWTQTGGTTYPCPDGGPNGFIVIIDHEVTANSNYCQAYRTTINNKLKIVSPYFGHNLGKVTGNGTLYLEIGSFPAGVYTEFLDCANNGTIEYGGTGTYTIVADLYTSVPNLLVSGSGSRILPAKDLTICRSLKINGPTLDNSTNNRKLTIQGTMEIASGAFNSGSGSNATVSFEGSTAQNIGGSLGNFTGSNAFNNFEINNTNGLTINTGGAIEVNGELRLTDGLINTNPALPGNFGTLTITNPAISCVIPSGGSSTSFVNGPLTKKINQGDDFLYPIGIYSAGIGNITGNKLSLSSSKTGTILWTASYNNPNPTFASYTAPIQGVSSKEYWNVKASAGSKSVINIKWDPQSDITPLVTQNGLSDMTIGTYQSGNWLNINSSATGNDYNGMASTNGLVTSTGSNDFTLAALSLLRPKAKLDPVGSTCGNAGIPVTFVSPLAIPLNYYLNYTIDGVAQTQIVISTLPYSLPTPVPGVYKLTSFSYNNGAGIGVVDASTVTVYAVPTTSDAGPDQALCGITSANLNANPLGITVGTGVWSIISGTGGTLITPTSRTSQFIGLNGATYKLRWTISNGTCKSTDDVIINFTLLPLAPAAAAAQTLCANSVISDIQVTPPSGSTVTWFSTASGGLVLPSTQLLVSGDYYAESNGGTGCLSLNRTKVTVTVIPQVWTGSVSTDWNVAGNWSCGSLPNINSNVQIPNVANKPILNGGAIGAVKNIVIDNNSSVTVTGNTLQIAGTITNNGTFTATSGTIEMKGTLAQNIGANTFAGNIIKSITVNNAAGLTLQGPLNVTGIVKAQIGNLVSAGNLTLVSTNSQTALVDGSGTGSITGNVSMQRYLPSGFGYKYISSPFQAATVNELADDVDLMASFPNLYKYDEDNHRDSSGVSIYTSGWANYSTTSNLLDPAKGYAANFGNSLLPKTATITGVLNNGSISQTLYNHNRTYTKGFNLVGNPYPSPIDWNAASGWTKNNIDNALYYFNAGVTDQYTGSYSSYINGVSSDGVAVGVIPSMQGFFIHISNGSFPVTANLGMDNRVRVNTLSPSFHKAGVAFSQPLLRLTAIYETEKQADPAVIYFDELSSADFDQDMDALKLMNTDITVPNLYTLTPTSERLSISAMPFPVDSLTESPLGLKTEQSNWIKLAAAGIENIPSEMYVYLKDKFTGKIQDLRLNPTYRVHIEKGVSEHRFSVIFSYRELSGTINESNSFYANIANGKLNVFVNLATGNDSQLTICNTLGQVMLKKNLYENGLHEIDNQLPSGIYILKLSSPLGVSSYKIYIPK